MVTGKIRKFFWLMVGMGGLVVYSTVGKDLKARWHSAVQSIQQRSQPSGAPATGVGAEPTSAVSVSAEEPVISPSGKTMVFKGKTYVQIDNQWLEKRDDNTYLVNGVKTYFVDQKAPTAEEKEKILDGDVETAENMDVLERIASGKMEAYSPAEVAKAVEKIKRARAKMEDRNQLLEELGSAEH